MQGSPRSTMDLTARVLIWSALGWTIGMVLLLLVFIEVDDNQTMFQAHGTLAVFLGLIPIAIVGLPLIAMVSRRIKRITPIVAGLTTAFVLLSIPLVGGFFLPAAIALAAAALLEIADSGGTET
jgi:hypothetical protein